MILCNQCGNQIVEESSRCSVCGARGATNKPLKAETVQSNLTLPSRGGPPPSSEPARTRASSIPIYIVIALLALIAGGGIVALLRPGKVEPAVNNSSSTSALPANDASPRDDSKREKNAGGKSNGSINQLPTPQAAFNPQPSTGTWFVVLGSFPKDDREKANQRLQSVQGSGYGASIVDTDNYPGFRGGLWAVVMGPYSKPQAKSVAD